MNKAADVPVAKRAQTSPSVKSNTLSHGKLATGYVDVPDLKSASFMAKNSLDTVALVLAGGAGTRLQPLTKTCCKPAVPFGGSNCIIDFSLSNCINSGIRRIGVLTQNEQHSLIRHIQNNWQQLNNDNNEFLSIMPTQHRYSDSGYRGTADAIAQNIYLLQQLSPKYTLILSGDHVYKADYRRMIEQHVATGADVTIACSPVPLSDASQFGIVSTDEHGRITDFLEKPSYVPEQARTGLSVRASMGVYVFSTNILLEKFGGIGANDEFDADIATDIIPSLIHHAHANAYDFANAQTENYWRDVGTLDAYYDANMELLESSAKIRMYDEYWPILGQGGTSWPARLIRSSTGRASVVSDSILASAVQLTGADIWRTIAFTGVHVNENSQIDQCLLLPGATIGKHCQIRNAIIGAGAIIPDNSVIGFDSTEDACHHSISNSGIVIVSSEQPPFVRPGTSKPCQKTHIPVTSKSANNAEASLPR